MAAGGKTLVVLNDAFEAKQALPYLKDADIVCLTLDAESSIREAVPNYKNQLHDLVLGEFKRGDRSYYFRNFKIAHTWYKEPVFEYVQDSFGYFLTELDRSLDLASYILKRFRPSRIIIGRQKPFRGFEIIHDSLDSVAISLLSNQKSLPVKFLALKGDRSDFRRTIGKLIEKVRFSKARRLETADLLVIAPKMHLMQMRDFIKELGKRISVTPITYGVSFSMRKDLKRYFPNLVEKENLIDSSIKQKAKKRLQRIIRQKDWNDFVHPKYKNQRIISKYLKNNLKRIVAEEFESIIFDIYLAESLMTTTKPKAILTTTDPDTKVLPFIKTAKATGVKTISLQHGADFTSTNPIYHAASEHYIAWSKLAALWSKKNIPNVKVYAGNSQFHKLVKASPRKTDKRLNLLFLTTINYFEREVPFFMLKLLDNLENQEEKITLSIRTHPAQPLENLTGLFTDRKIKIVWDRSSGLNDSISKSDAVIFENTTAGLDAMLAGKPAVYFNPYDGDDYFSMQQRGITTILNEKEIATKINEFFKQKSRWATLSSKGRDFAIEYLGLSKDKDAKLAKLVLKLMR